jgi:hypothetical protein
MDRARRAAWLPGRRVRCGPDPWVRSRWPQAVVVLSFIGVIARVAQALDASPESADSVNAVYGAPSSADGTRAECCRVPEFAKAIGHEEMWKRHNNCL